MTDRIAELKAEIERLQSECDEHAAAYRHCSEERAKLQAALERIESNIGFSKTFLQKIAREALRDEYLDNRSSDLLYDDLIAIIVRQQRVFEYLLTLDLPPRAKRTCEEMLDPVRAAGPAGSEEVIRILSGARR